jgi:hypothetical protein
MKHTKGFTIKRAERSPARRDGFNRLVVGLISLVAAMGLFWGAFNPARQAVTRAEVTTGSHRAANEATSSKLGTSQSGKEPVLLPGVAVILTPNGFQPPQLTRPPGKFVLAVVPQIGSLDFSFRLDDGLGRHLRAAQVPSEQPHWADVYDLPPGTYTLRELNHAEWVCQITIKQ